ncbi:hypothetical protein K227x_14270 [Rubripirellula lacrimiformis]|uniref:DUF2262 domain-containing protein n=2 Tax=Rubripirellula lacrimiformis TaxID=1930273 RepID=A0A517N7S2_9BACT|nr:hypothetical protein K227x_14270 [Rubripirellula lacrimiformis]
MWPFQNRESKKRTPCVSIGDIVATWGQDGWSFSDGTIDFTMYENDIFDTSILHKLPDLRTWISNLQTEIDAIINEHVADWGLERDDREIVAIDVSRLATENQVDVAYGCEQWADYGVNIVITNGRITESYGGD